MEKAIFCKIAKSVIVCVAASLFGAIIGAACIDAATVTSSTPREGKEIIRVTGEIIPRDA
jgi:hypothetical protein